MRVTVTIMCLFLVFSGVIVADVYAATDAIDVQWWPEAQVVHVGSQVDLQLYLVPNVPVTWPISALDVIVLHSKDGTGTPYLTYQGFHTTDAPYEWFASGLPSTSPDGINVDKYDGEFIYTAFAEPGEPAYVPPSGLLVSTFQFLAQTVVADSSIITPATYGSRCKTAVWDGTLPNKNVVGLRGSAKVMVVPQDVQIASSVAESKSFEEETQVAFVGAVVTRSFDNFFYIEDQNRAGGIRVNFIGEAPAEGNIPMVWGVIRVVDGERVIDDASVSAGGSGNIPGSLAMNCTAPFVGLNPQGLLVTLSGRADSVSGASEFFLNDGSPNPVRVELHGFGAPPNQSFVSVTGVLGADSYGPVLRVRHASNVIVAQ
ncbi:MAG: hypothetical protein GX811_12190 [Lentisphaerae bacterium]|nr:hypothetical protein [Lentisphaerota bacterium]